MSDVQYAVQVRVNPGRPSEYWDFDNDWDVHSDVNEALSDMEYMINGLDHSPENVRVAVIVPWDMWEEVRQ